MEKQKDLPYSYNGGVDSHLENIKFLNYDTAAILALSDPDQLPV